MHFQDLTMRAHVVCLLSMIVRLLLKGRKLGFRDEGRCITPDHDGPGTVAMEHMSSSHITHVD